jgi:transposase
MGRPRKYRPELLDRGARGGDRVGRADRARGPRSWVPPETLRRYVRQLEADGGLRPDLPTSEEREEIKRLRRGLRAAPRQRDPQGASVSFATELDADRPE